MQNLTDHVARLDADTIKRPGCAILIEDTISANQVALYQVIQGYYDELQRLDNVLQDHLSLLMSAQTINFGTQIAGQSNQVTVTLTNTGSDPIDVSIGKMRITGTYTDESGLSAPAASLVSLAPGANPCGNVLAPGGQCTIKMTFPSPDVPAPLPGKLTAELDILIGQNSWFERIKLTGEVRAASKDDFKNSLEDFKQYLNSIHTDVAVEQNQQLQREIRKFPPPKAEVAGPAPEATTTGGGGASASPASLTYLSGIMTALGAVKSGITYAPSSFQPTTQAFEVLIEAELKNAGIDSYTSTSPLNLEQARIDLTRQFGEMLNWASRVNSWAALCKPANTNGVTSETPKGAANPACADDDVIANLAIAQQMVTGYMALLTTANDGSGNPVIVDVLRGKVLSEKMKKGIPSLQVAVSTAGGSTRTNSFFLLNLFYTPKPSYNAGVIATFEFRDKDNELVESGARNVLFDYNKWKPGAFDPAKLAKESDGDCESFCTEEVPLAKPPVSTAH